ncbi:SIR2 family protein [Clostridium estertheticum]|uniref:SIR2-like domain-containing protein n=1 Tax=Clostridium estertheticum TaxID=238834 RepID=A0A7Y3SVY2_9CLOT|nr:SIR2 family protein [Clostridium estertheticum]NNU76355.1 hypothetical protein [Clostridium estertheticum]WBL45846.1 SIR2 family protein [Clostridium estertheticum]
MEITSKYLDTKNGFMESRYAFKTLVLKSISNHFFEKEKKELILNYHICKDKHIYEFDGIISDGVEGLEGGTIIEVKTYRDKLAYFRNARRIAMILNNKLDMDSSFKSVLLVIGDSFSADDKLKLSSTVSSLVKATIKIWDINDIRKIDSQFDAFINGDFTKITEIVVDNAVNKSLTNVDDWAHVRNDRLEELKSVYNNDELVLFLGAGISKDAGISDWNDLISDLLVLMIKNKFSDKKISMNDAEINLVLTELKKSNDNSPIIQAAFVKAGLGDSFENEVSKLLYMCFDNENKGSSNLLKSISRLCLPRRNGVGIQAVVTYNFDDLLEVNVNEHNIRYHSLYNELDCINLDELGIYHVHGFLPRDPDAYEQLSEELLVFSEDGYHSLYNDPYSWANITQLNFLREKTVLMIGLSLTDPNLRRLLAISNRKTKTTKHFAIMKRYKFSSSTDENVRDDILKSFNNVNNELQENFFEQIGIKIIWVDDYNEVPILINSLRDK